MHVSFQERDDEFAEVTLHKDRAVLQAARHDDHVVIRVSDCCDGVEAVIRIRLTCREYERLLCELERVECGRRHCRCEDDDDNVVIVFDQDDCDDDDKPVRRSPKRPAAGGRK